MTLKFDQTENLTTTLFSNNLGYGTAPPYVGYAAVTAAIIAHGWLTSSNPKFNHPRLN